MFKGAKYKDRVNKLYIFFFMNLLIYVNLNNIYFLNNYCILVEIEEKRFSEAAKKSLFKTV
jgi:hypothetical protein